MYVTFERGATSQDITERDNMPTKEVAAVGEIVDLLPEQILADSNDVRFALKRYRLDSLKAAILRDGKVNEFLEVEPLDEPIDGYSYRLTVGGYRHAAVTELNADGANLRLPCQVQKPETPMNRLRRQISENNDRENLSPIDRALAMQKMLDLGAAKMDVREAFATAGGRKGLKMQPLSNSSVNMHLSFLEFPKSIQTKIHDGVITVDGAYQLSKVPKEKQGPIIEALEAERQKQIDREEADEDRSVKAEAKLLEQEKKAKEKKENLEKLENEAAEALKAGRTKAEEAAKLEADAKKVQDEEVRLTIEAKAKKLQKEAEAQEKKHTTLSTKVADVKKKLKEEAAKAKEKAAELKKAATAKPISGKDVIAASENEGRVVLNRTNIMKTLKELQLPSGDETGAKVGQVALAFQECFDSIITDAQLYKRLRAIIEPAKAAKKKTE